MATRRMMSRRVVESARFLRLPAASRALYFQLLADTDDDGVVEAWAVMQLTGASAGDLDALTAAGFVRVLNEELVCYLPDFLEHNQIRPDRKTDSIYRSLLESVVPDVRLIEPKKPGTSPRKKAAPQSTVNCPSDVRALSAICPPSIGECRTGQVRSGQPSAGEEAPAAQSAPNHTDSEPLPSPARKNEIRSGSVVPETTSELPEERRSRKAEPAASERRCYGQYRNVLLTDSEYSAIQKEYPEQASSVITKLDEYMETTGKRYSSHIATLRKWAREDCAAKPATRGGAGPPGTGAPQEDPLTRVDLFALKQLRARLAEADRCGESAPP